MPIQAAIEADSDSRVADLHVWRVGPSHLAVIVSVVTHTPHSPEHSKELLAEDRDLARVTGLGERVCWRAMLGSRKLKASALGMGKDVVRSGG